jgi:hypothetical protein
MTLGMNGFQAAPLKSVSASFVSDPSSWFRFALRHVMLQAIYLIPVIAKIWEHYSNQ